MPEAYRQLFKRVRSPESLSLPEAWAFPLAMGLLSRAVILLAMLLLAHWSAPSKVALGNWRVLVGWDSGYYLSIATQGYQFVDDGKGYNVAFFPGFPLLIRAAMSLGIPPEVAGILVNNLAFLGALLLVYHWVAQWQGRTVARWTTAVLAWCPFSLFGTVVYTEGLFLLCSTAALRSFQFGQYRWAAFWGVLTSATRLPGLVLVPTFLSVAWKEKRPPIAYFSSLVAGLGTVLYSLFCWLQFREPFAFLKVQKAWHPQAQAFGEGWLKMLVQITLGPGTWTHGRIVDPLYPIALLVITGLMVLLARSRQRVGPRVTNYGVCLLGILLWLLAGAPLVNALMVWGGGYLLWRLRRDLPAIVLIYGLLSLLLILATGRTVSAERYAYAIVSLELALGLLLARYPRWGYPVLGFFALLLVSLSVRFAQQLWAG